MPFKYIDLVGKLKHNGMWPVRTPGPFWVLHYNGPSTAKFKTDRAVIDNDADWHVDNNRWPGIAYHWAVGREGTIFKLNKHESRLNHAGVAWANNQAIAVQLTVGEGDKVSDAQFNGLLALLAEHKVLPRYVSTHQEAPRATSCPGAIIQRWVDRVYRPQHSGGVYIGKVAYTANVRDEPSVLSHQLRQLSKGTAIHGKIVLGKPVSGDAQWVQLTGTTDYVHASALT